MVAISCVIISLPFIKVDISAQSRGLIRTPMENIILQSSIYGEVIEFRMRENKNVKEEQNGRFIEEGNHQSLYVTGTNYYEMWQKQLPKNNNLLL